MKTDSVTIDFGYFVNAGFSRKWGENSDIDNQMGLMVGVQLGDTDALSDLSTTPLSISIQANGTLVSGNEILCKKASLAIIMPFPDWTKTLDMKRLFFQNAFKCLKQ